MSFWAGFEKQAISREEQIKHLERRAAGMDRAGKTVAGLTAAAGGAGALAGILKKKKGLAIGSGLLGLLGAANIPGESRYGKGLRSHAKGLSGKSLTKKERDQLAMMNPSKSLMQHVHPKYRGQASKHYSEVK